MTHLNRRTVPALVAVAALGLGASAPVALAGHGADDSTAHRADHDHGTRHHHRHHGHHHHHGADDGANHS
jgi:hypothetical protein